MPTLERPRLRTGLAAAQDENDPRYVFVWDELHLSSQIQRLSRLEFAWLQLFDGQHNLRDIHAEAMRHHPSGVRQIAPL